MSVLIGADLDRTLIFSRGALRSYGHGERRLVAVEQHHHADSSWMTEQAVDHLHAVHDSGAMLVPATTRTVKQLKRVTLPGPPARLAIAANGGVLLVDGVPDPSWSRTVSAALAGVAPLAEIQAEAARVCQPEWTKSLRTAEGMFCYAVLYRSAVPPGLVEQAAAWSEQRGWRVSLQGRKLYWVPRTLSKGAALAEAARRTGADTVLAAGDSLLDADLLDAADQAIVARHGELAASGWEAAHAVRTRTRGVLAGEEILAWLRARAAESGRLSARDAG